MAWEQGPELRAATIDRGPSRGLTVREVVFELGDAALGLVGWSDESARARCEDVIYRVG